MEAFEYAHPSSLKEAVGLLGSRWGEAELLAGGTDLLSLMKNYVAAPKRLVSLKDVNELRGIESVADGVRLGALVTLEEMRENATIQRDFPALVQAAEGVASMQIRNVGTVGGDLCQRPRCWYFRNGFGLLARDAQGRSLVLEGDNRYHAILGNDGPAYFVHPSSLAPPLMALEARAGIFGPEGTREVSLGDFFRTPQSNDDRETVLRPNEILTAITIPASVGGWRNATYEVREREFLDWPLATASVSLQFDGGAVTQARVVLGHVAPVPWRSREAEQALMDQKMDEATAERAGNAAVRPAKALSKNAYKVQLARVAVKRALLAAMKGV